MNAGRELADGDDDFPLLRATAEEAMAELMIALRRLEAEVDGFKTIGSLAAVVVARVRFDVALNSYIAALGLTRS